MGAEKIVEMPPARRRRAALLVIALVAVAVAVPLAAPPPADAAPTGYVRMSDGTLIAVNVRMPDGYVKGKRYPTIFEMSGYDGGSADGEAPDGSEGSRGLTKIFYDDYVTVHASVRGTGCSSGEFDLFSWRSALDGREVIEWIARQQWSDGDVGYYGHSYGGITGFMIAATRPPHLRAASLSGLIDDLYRGMVYPGGVSNYGFPLLWTGAVRNVYDIGGGSLDGLMEGDPICARNVASHRRTILNDPIVQGLSDTDNDWWRSRSLINYVDRINVPVHITGAYQDEQTGPRGPHHLFEELRVPKRLLMTNGDHGTQTGPKEIYRDRRAWLDYWVRSSGSGHRRTSVTTLFELSGGRSNGRKDSRTFPLEDTHWTNVFLRAGGGLSFTRPRQSEPADRYISGSPRQGWSYQAGHEAGSPVTTAGGPDELTYTTGKFTRPVAVAGPMTATLFVSSTATDTELFVQLIDIAPDGTRYYVQRGMLKASHRAIDRSLSDRTASGRIYRPHRPHTNPTEITPGATYRYLVEVWPAGHVFRPGHRLAIKLHTPPAVDSYYSYVPKRAAGVNTVFHDRAHPSRLMLPIVPLDGVGLGPAPKSCSLDEVRCVR